MVIGEASFNYPFQVDLEIMVETHDCGSEVLAQVLYKGKDITAKFKEIFDDVEKEILDSDEYLDAHEDFIGGTNPDAWKED